MREHVKDFRYYLEVFKKRKKLFIIPAVAIFLIATAVAVLLPPVYESASTILIEEQQIPPDFVRSTVTGFADQRITSLTQQILSRSKLVEIIQQLDLYPEMRKEHTKEEIAKEMRKNISIEMISAEVGGRSGGRKSSSGPAVTIAFTISYRGEDPNKLQKVAGTLASLYLEQNIKQRETQAQTTTQFLEAELKNLETTIRTIGEKITNFKEKNEGMLPEMQQSNLSQKEHLENDIKQLDINIRSTEERRVYLEGQLATAKQGYMPAESAERTGDPATRLRILEVTLADFRAKFSPDHPDIRKLLREKAELEKMLGHKGEGDALRQDKLAALKMELAQKQGKYSEQHPDIIKIKKEMERLEGEVQGKKSNPIATESNNPNYLNLLTQIKVAGGEVEALKKQRANVEERLREYQRRLEEGPKGEQEYLALQRDYNNAHQKHQEVMNKILEARIAEGMEEHQKGEKFSIIEPASHPDKPIQPNRPLIIISGLFFSLMVGYGAVLLAENLDHSVKSADELAWLTGIPVLGAIKRIQLAEDVEWEHSRRRLINVVIVFSLITVVALFHFFYMDLFILTAKFSRLLHKHM